MDTKVSILQYIKKKKALQGGEICRLLGISRQAVNKHLKELIKEEKVIKEGSTRGSVYYYAKYKKDTIQRYRRKYSLTGLEEDIVFKEIELFLNLKKKLKENIFNIIQYAFTEILNNAIEHSQSKYSLVEFVLSPQKCIFKIRDYGIGIFHSIFTKFKLHNESEAAGELIKGKRTTMPKRHTGEGVFFTSKSGDSVNFRSHRINLLFDNIEKDVFAEEKRFIKGTEVNFSINTYSKRVLGEIFNFYAPEEFDYRFEKTKVFVRLFQETYMSRSEARRLLSGLGKFKEIILDFQGVKSIGQGFADEVFRVFQRENPDKLIKIENLNPSLRSIIEHIVDNKI